MDILFFGLGSIGSRHARLIRNNFPQHRIFAYRSFRGQSPVGHSGYFELYSWDEIDQIQPQIAFICNPTYLHVRTAMDCASRGMHLFVEKPLGCTSQGLDDLLTMVKTRRLLSYVAYPFRHLESVQRLAALIAKRECEYLGLTCRTWMPGWRNYDHQGTYSYYRVKGGGVLLELSHEIDLAAYLLGPVKEIRGDLLRISDVTLDADDYADLVIEHESGQCSELNLSICSNREMRHWSARGPGWGWMLEPRADDELYLAQLRYFFSHVERDEPMMNDLEEATGLLGKILEFDERRHSPDNRVL